MPPEQLRAQNNNHSIKINNFDVKKCDVYSFGMTIFEIVSQRIPFDNYLKINCPIPVLLENIKNGHLMQNNTANTKPELFCKEQFPLRPSISSQLMAQRKHQCLWKLMEHCWNEEPASRPNFSMIEQYFHKAFKNLR